MTRCLLKSPGWDKCICGDVETIIGAIVLTAAIAIMTPIPSNTFRLKLYGLGALSLSKRLPELS